MSFPDAGYHVQRDGDRYLIFDCGPLGDGGHGHYDLLSFEMAAGGRPEIAGVVPPLRPEVGVRAVIRRERQRARRQGLREAGAILGERLAHGNCGVDAWP